MSQPSHKIIVSCSSYLERVGISDKIGYSYSKELQEHIQINVPNTNVEPNWFCGPRTSLYIVPTLDTWLLCIMLQEVFIR